MYAVVSTGGKQYRVEAGNELVVERVAGDVGSTITFDRILLVGDGEAVTIGTPIVEGATVSGTVLGEALGPKLIVFKFKQKATYRRKNGHRQHMTRVRIDEISAGGKKAKPAPKAEATEPKAEATEPKAEKAGKAQKAAPVETAEKKPARRTSTKPKAAKADATETASDEAKPKRTRKPAARKAPEAETAEE